jgi:hypothetical protein
MLVYLKSQVNLEAMGIPHHQNALRLCCPNAPSNPQTLSLPLTSKIPHHIPRPLQPRPRLRQPLVQPAQPLRRPLPIPPPLFLPLHPLHNRDFSIPFLHCLLQQRLILPLPLLLKPLRRQTRRRPSMLTDLPHQHIPPRNRRANFPP